MSKRRITEGISTKLYPADNGVTYKVLDGDLTETIYEKVDISENIKDAVIDWLDSVGFTVIKKEDRTEEIEKFLNDIIYELLESLKKEGFDYIKNT